MLSSYFSHNCTSSFSTAQSDINEQSRPAGEPYKYVSGTQQTVPLDETAPAVRDALKLIQERAALVLGHQPELNEVLSAGYIESQRMKVNALVLSC